MRDAKAFTAGGSVVVYLHGTVAFQVPDDELSRRLSIALAVTSRRGYLLTWFFAAPHDSELKELLEEKIAFDADPPTEEASAPKPGGGKFARQFTSCGCHCRLSYSVHTQPAATSAQRRTRVQGPNASQATPLLPLAADPVQTGRTYCLSLALPVFSGRGDDAGPADQWQAASPAEALEATFGCWRFSSS